MRTLLLTYALLVLLQKPAFSFAPHRGKPAGEWMERDGIIYVLTCFTKQRTSYLGRCPNPDELSVLLINKSNEQKQANLRCMRIEGDEATTIATLSVPLQALTHAEYSVRLEALDNAAYGVCRLVDREVDSTPGWEKVR